ncbi:hypothetical protein R2Q81_03375 [Microbacterium aquimaris]|uniref:hypothetical protein n=1 Tax=Microbacterium aquimaris TaxID=459816 RepID=UPI002AD33DFA|nr:hypothetical protein [Microbacterium aquimaris]MDZ8274985.1 hypothetical protein [Microbacterium aquimaris]
MSATPGAPDPSGSGGGAVRPGVAVVFASVGDVALLIFGLGMTSLITDESVIATPGLGQAPGAVAVAASVGAFALSLLTVVRRRDPSFVSALWVGLVTALAYLAALWMSVLLVGAGLGTATAVSARVATTGFGAVVIGAALVSGWAGIALVRTRSARPRWSWEDEDDA